MMKYRPLPRTGLALSEIGFGCMSLGENHKENSQLIHQAIDSGINYFDTADLYQKGFNEETVGRALKGKREEIILATKVGNELIPDGKNWKWNPRKNYILKAIDNSLKRLQTDYIDIYQLHGGTMEDPFEETIEAFEILQKQGKIKHYGLSSIRPNVIKRFLNHSNMVSNMIQYSLLDRRPEEELLDTLVKNKVGTLARGVLSKGKLADFNKFITLIKNTKSPEYKYFKDNLFSIEKTTDSQLSIQWVLRNKSISSAVIGVRNKQQLEDAISAISKDKFTEEIFTFLEKLFPPTLYELHRD